MMSRAAQTHLAGHMRPAGRVFETPALKASFFIFIPCHFISLNTIMNNLVDIQIKILPNRME